MLILYPRSSLGTNSRLKSSSAIAMNSGFRGFHNYFPPRLVVPSKVGYMGSFRLAFSCFQSTAQRPFTSLGSINIRRFSAQTTPDPAMTNRLKQIASHLTGSSNDVVITMAIRTPLGKGFKGSFKDTPADLLTLNVMKAVVAQSGIDPALVEDICVGNVLGGSNNTYASRAAALAAGFPSTTSVHGINRWCSSGLLATGTIANSIKAGEIDIGLAIGVESMSEHKGMLGFAFFLSTLLTL